VICEHANIEGADSIGRCYIDTVELSPVPSPGQTVSSLCLTLLDHTS